MENMISLKYVVNSLVFAFIGLFVYAIGFALLDIITPKVSIWKEIVEKQNVAVAIFVGALAYGIATIIASAIHG